MFKVGDRVVANGFFHSGNYHGEGMLLQIKNKTVLTVNEVLTDWMLGTIAKCLPDNWSWHKSELRYATEEEIKEADKGKIKVEKPYLFQGGSPLIWPIADGQPFFSMSNPGWDSMSPDDFNITNEFSSDEIEVSNDSDHVRLDIADEDDDNSNHTYLEPQEARATAKALCEHADYVEKMKAKVGTSGTKGCSIANAIGGGLVKPGWFLTTPWKLFAHDDKCTKGVIYNKESGEYKSISISDIEKVKPKQPVFKIWKEGVKDEDGVVWLRLEEGPYFTEIGIIGLVAVDFEGDRISHGSILWIDKDGTLGRVKNCKVPGIQTDSDGCVKEAE